MPKSIIPINRDLITDDVVRHIYDILISQSFEDSGKNFEELQGCWNVLAFWIGVSDVTNNGHGKVVWE